MASLARADELEAQAAAATERGTPADLRTASMLLFHAAGVLDSVLLQQSAQSQLLPSQESALKHRAALLRARAEEQQRASVAAAAAKQAQLQKDRPSSVAAVAAVGAAAALVAVGPVTALVAAAGCALATTRGDGVGDLARSTGALAADAVASARGFDRDHGISVKASKVAAHAEARFNEFEDSLKERHPAGAAMMGTAARAAKFAAGSSCLALAASVLTAPDEQKK